MEKYNNWEVSGIVKAPEVKSKKRSDDPVYPVTDVSRRKRNINPDYPGGRCYEVSFHSPLNVRRDGHLTEVMRDLFGK